MEVESLYTWSQRSLLWHSNKLIAVLQYGAIPSKIHKDLFVEGAISMPRYGAELQTSVAELVARWPLSTLTLCELLPEKQAAGLMRHEGRYSLQAALLQGLLNVKAQSPISVLDISGVSAACIFQLPLMFLTPSERLSPDLLNSVMHTCRGFAGEDDTMESMLSWKLEDIRKHSLPSSYHGNSILEVRVSSDLSLRDWVAISTEVLGLCTEHLSPYRFLFTSLSIDNFTLDQIPHLRWLLSTIDTRLLKRFCIYGKRKHMRLVMWEMHQNLAKLPNLESFGLAVTGPKIATHLVNPNEPSNSQVMERCKQVLPQWDKLNELQLVGMTVSPYLDSWLSPLHSQLRNLSLYACKLVKQDIVILSQTHHVSHLKQLALEKNDLKGCGEAICDIVRRASKLELLNLRETGLEFAEKQCILVAVQSCECLETLAIYEQEDMHTQEGYEELVRLACGVPRLKHFYVFPFNYHEFEVLFREAVEKACDVIKCKNNRSELFLYY